MLSLVFALSTEAWCETHVCNNKVEVEMPGGHGIFASSSNLESDIDYSHG